MAFSISSKLIACPSTDAIGSPGTAQRVTTRNANEIANAINASETTLFIISLSF